MNTETSNNKKVNAIIAKRNKQFKAASKTEKRILIAKDVIKQIKDGRIIPTEGNWVEASIGLEVTGNTSFRQAFFEGTVDTCDCCALGSLMTSCTLFKNKVTVCDYDSGALDFTDLIEGEVDDQMGFLNIFPKKQLAMIEIAFETGGGRYSFNEDSLLDYDHNKFYYNGASFNECKDALHFGLKYLHAEDRLVAIMKNIIKNKGQFKPGN